MVGPVALKAPRNLSHRHREPFVIVEKKFCSLAAAACYLAANGDVEEQHSLEERREPRINWESVQSAGVKRHRFSAPSPPLNPPLGAPLGGALTQVL